MNRILLVDDSPHAQRIGERILSEEGFEVVTVSNGDSALIRLEDADPDVLVLKAVMPGRNGYDICRFVKMSPRHRHVRVILTAGATESLDEAEVQNAGADGTLKKPFEASALVGAVRPLAEAADHDRAASPTAGPRLPLPPAPKPADARLTAPVIAVIDPEQVRAAVTVALDASMAAMTEEITTRVLAALTARRSPGDRIETRAAPPPPGQTASAPPLETPSEPVRSVSRPAGPFGSAPGRQPLRIRPGSILGLDVPADIPAPNPAKPDSNESS